MLIYLKHDFCQDRICLNSINALCKNSMQKNTFDVIAEDVLKSVETGN